MRIGLIVAPMFKVARLQPARLTWRLVSPPLLVSLLAASPRYRHEMRRRTLLAAATATLLLSGCWWPRFFDLSWDEEVQLHDGRVVVVKVKYTYERLGGFSFNRYEPSILREATLSFDAGSRIGRVSERFIHQRPMLLDTDGEEWFVVLQGRAGRAVQDWGSEQNGNGQRTARLVGLAFKPTPIDRLPLWMSTANVLMDYAPVRELAAFNETRLTLAQKAIYLQKYPLGPIDMRIERK